MKTQEFKDLIAATFRKAGLDFHSCRTLHEKRVWMGSAIELRDELEDAKCPRSSKATRDQRAVALRAINHRILEVMSVSQAADNNLQKMAFAEEWR